MSEVLDQIEAAETAREQEQQAAQEAASQPEQAMDPADAWAQIPATFGSILAMAMPELEKVYTPKACRAWGEGMHLVAQKYGWDAAQTVAKFGPELALAAATFPLAAGTIKTIKAHRASNIIDITPEDESGAPAEGAADGSQS
jgi:hypothetical protein